MRYVIAVENGGHEDATVPMDVEEACDLFYVLTGEDYELEVGEEIAHEIGEEAIFTLRPATLPELVYEDEDGTHILDYVIDEFSDDRKKIALERTKREYGDLVPDEDDESEFAENFANDFDRHLIEMAVQDLVDYHVAEGEVEAVDVLDDGKITYALTETDEDDDQD